MKYCINCNKKLRNEAKYCNVCGEEQPLKKRKSKRGNNVGTDEVSDSIDKYDSEKIDHESFRNNQTLENITVHSKNYFAYLNKNVIFPQLIQVKKFSFFGIINYIMITIFSALTVSHTIGTVANPLFSIVSEIKSSFNYGYEDLNYFSRAFPFLFKLLALFSLLYFSFVVILYLFTLLLCYEKPRFVTIFNELFDPISVGVYSSVVIFILTFIVSSTSPIIILGMWIPLFLLSVAFVGLLWKKSIKIKQHFYVVVGTIILGFFCILMFVIIGASFF